MSRFAIRLEGDILMVSNTQNQREYRRRITRDVCEWNTKSGADRASVFAYPKVLEVIASLIKCNVGCDIAELCADCATVLFTAEYHPTPCLTCADKLIVHCFRTRREPMAIVAQLEESIDTLCARPAERIQSTEITKELFRELRCEMRINNELDEIMKKFGIIPPQLIPLARAIVISAGDALGMFRVGISVGAADDGGWQLIIRIGERKFSITQPEDPRILTQCMLWCAATADVTSWFLGNVNVSDIPAFGLIIRGKLPRPIIGHPNLRRIAMQAIDIEQYDVDSVWDEMRPLIARGCTIVVPKAMRAGLHCTGKIHYHAEDEAPNFAPWHYYTKWSALGDADAGELENVDPRTEYFAQIASHCCRYC